MASILKLFRAQANSIQVSRKSSLKALTLSLIIRNTLHCPIEKLAVILVVILTACGGESDKEKEFDLVDHLLQRKYLYWKDDSITFIYKGDKYTSRYGIIEDTLRYWFPHSSYPNCHKCGYLLFEKKELNTLYQSFCSSPFLIKIIDDEGVIRYYNEPGFGHNPEPDDGILHFRVAKNIKDKYDEEYKIYSSRWYTKDGMTIMEDNEANEIYQKFLQCPCRSFIIHSDKSQTLIIPDNCD